MSRRGNDVKASFTKPLYSLVIIPIRWVLIINPDKNNEAEAFFGTDLQLGA
jgi:hypothetical protein